MAYLMFVLAVLTRFIPHPWNFSPVFGALLFGGARLPKRDFLWFPLAVLSVSDVLLTTQVYGMKMQWTYGLGSVAFAAVALIGRWMCREVTVRRFTAAAFAGPTAFYLISNFVARVQNLSTHLGGPRRLLRCRTALLSQLASRQLPVRRGLVWPL